MDLAYHKATAPECRIYAYTPGGAYLDVLAGVVRHALQDPRAFREQLVKDISIA